MLGQGEHAGVVAAEVELQLGVDVEGVCKAKVGHLHLDQSFFRFYETKIPATNIQSHLSCSHTRPQSQKNNNNNKAEQN